MSWKGRGKVTTYKGRWFSLLLGVCGLWPVSVHGAMTNPTLVWNIFLGGSGTEYGHAVAVDSSGNIYVAGESNATWGAPVRAFADGNWDAYVAKLDPNGNLIWNTFLGTGDWPGDSGLCIAVDASGNVYVGGYSQANWGTPLQAYAGGNYDGFVAKLDTDGNLLWNTFLGGIGDDWITSLGVDPGGDIYVEGESSAKWGSAIRLYAAGEDVFVAKLSNNGTLLWNTFLGGGGDDFGAFKLAVDPNNAVYVGGHSSAAWGSPLRAFTAGAAGATDAFVAKLGADGSLIWNTFLGGTSSDEVRALALDSGGNALYTCGYSGSTWGSPLTPYAGGVSDGFLAKLGKDGGMIWQTFLGGSDQDIADSIALSAQGDLFVSGFSRTSWGTPWRPFAGGLSDAFVAAYSNSGNLRWNAFFGSSGGAGPDDDYGNGLAMDSTGNLYLHGDSDATWGLPLRAFTSNHDAFAARISDVPPTPTPTPTVTVTSVPMHAELLKIIQPLLQPERFQPIVVSLSLEQSEQVTLAAYDLTGRKVSVITDGVLPAGGTLINWDGGTLGSGTYLLWAKTKTRQGRGKVVVVR
jgi:hypothetical protein